jgi:uncharacterized protein (DUF885 family)
VQNASGDMNQPTDQVALLSDLREKAERARRLASSIHDHKTIDRLRAYADEMDTEAAQLEREIQSRSLPAAQHVVHQQQQVQQQQQQVQQQAKSPGEERPADDDSGTQSQSVR